MFRPLFKNGYGIAASVHLGAVRRDQAKPRRYGDKGSAHRYRRLLGVTRTSEHPISRPRCNRSAGTATRRDDSGFSSRSKRSTVATSLVVSADPDARQHIQSSARGEGWVQEPKWTGLAAGGVDGQAHIRAWSRRGAGLGDRLGRRLSRLRKHRRDQCSIELVALAPLTVMPSRASLRCARPCSGRRSAVSQSSPSRLRSARARRPRHPVTALDPAYGPPARSVPHRRPVAAIQAWPAAARPMIVWSSLGPRGRCQALASMFALAARPAGASTRPGTARSLCARPPAGATAHLLISELDGGRPPPREPTAGRDDRPVGGARLLADRC